MRISLKIILVVIVVVILGFFALNKPDALIKNMDIPNKVEFSFRDIRIEKDGPEMKVVLTSPLYVDARGLGEKRESYESKISTEDFSALWSLISKIDFEKYKNPSAENFIPAPSDVSTLEKIYFKIDGREIINKSYEQQLFGKLVEPLEEIVNLAKK